MMKTDPVGLYVHIPFCLKKCNYCDFCSFPNLPATHRVEYIKRLIREITSYKRDEKIKLDTVFFGGGTPSLLSPDEFFAICRAIGDSFDVMPNAEFTLEANPKTLTRENLSAFITAGVNRVSIGLQSIHENELKILGRVHSYSDFKEAFRLVRSSGISNINVDVMYGIPEQNIESFKKTLGAVVDLDIPHVSAYGLILEENTRFFDIKDELFLPTEDEECDMYEYATEFLSSGGFSHYEISNYSKPGFSSRHNMKYWTMRDFIGVGAAAYSFFDGKRFGNSRDLSEYINSECTQYNKVDPLSEDDLAYEYVMLGLRLKDGISLSEYKSRFGKDFLLGRREKTARYSSLGYMNISGDRLSLTEKGFYISNTILTDLL